MGAHYDGNKSSDRRWWHTDKPVFPILTLAYK
jgi:hypothetical protein